MSYEGLYTSKYLSKCASVLPKPLSHNTVHTVDGGLHVPGNMGASINKDRLKVFGELWSFLLAVLDDIIGQIQERQLPVAFSWRRHKNTIYFKVLFHVHCTWKRAELNYSVIP